LARDGGNWTTIRVRNVAERAAVIAKLFELGAEGVEELDDGVVTHLRAVDRTTVTGAVQRADAKARIELSETPAVDWTREWRTRLTAHRVGKLVVTPPWMAGAFDAS